MMSCYCRPASMVLLALIAAALPAEEITITGRVLGPDGAPVAGAAVGANSRDADLGRYGWVTTTTGADGSFTLQPIVGEGEDLVYVVCAADGYAVDGGPLPAAEEVVLRLNDQVRQVSGTVTDPEGQPIAGAEVMLSGAWRIPMPANYRDMETDKWNAWYLANGVSVTDWEGAPRAIADANGEFTVGGIPAAGGAHLFASARDYLLAASQVPSDESRVTIEMHPAATIAGRVTLDGEPVAGATVHVGRRGGGLMHRLYRESAQTDADGRYELHGVPPRTCSVRVEGTQDYAMTIRDDVEVALGQPLEGVDIELTRGVPIEGRLVWQDSEEPIPNAQVRLRHKPMRGFGQTHVARIDDTGRFIVRVPPGDYNVWVDGVWAVEGPSHLTIADTAPPPLALEGVRRPTMTVQVLDPDGTPAAGIEVLVSETAHFMSDEEPERLVADDEGRISIRSHARSRSGDGSWHPTLSVLVQDHERGLAIAEYITSGGEHRLQLAHGGWLEFRVIDEEGQPCEGARFWMKFAGTERLVLVDPRSDAEGLVRIGPLPGGLEVEFMATHEVQQIMTNDNWSRPRPRTRQVVAGETVTLPDVIVHPGGLSARGLVVSADGEPVAGASVYCRERIAGRYEPVVTDAEGRWEIPDLRPRLDAMVFVAVGPQGALAAAQLADPRMALDVVLDLRPPASVHGVLVTADGEPAADEKLQISTPGSLRKLPEGLPMQSEVMTDEQGRWRVESLVPGVEYRASVAVSEHTYRGIGQFFAEGDVGPITLTMPEGR